MKQHGPKLDLKQQIVVMSLKKMMRSSFFSICEVHDAGKVLGINPRHSPSYDMLYALHCVHWNTMPNDVRKAVPGMIMECLAAANVEFGTIPETVQVLPLLEVLQAMEPPKPLYKRLLQRLAS